MKLPVKQPLKISILTILVSLLIILVSVFCYSEALYKLKRQRYERKSLIIPHPDIRIKVHYYGRTAIIREMGKVQNGLREGTWKSFDEYGKKVIVENYRQGVKNGDWMFFDKNGKILVKEFLQNGVNKDGMEIKFYEMEKNIIYRHIKYYRTVGNEKEYEKSLGYTINLKKDQSR